MSRVFLIGAGYIGNAVAIALRQAGHSVTVLVRSSAKAAELLKNEIRVVEGDLKNVETYQKQIEEANYIIDATGDLQSAFTLFGAIEKASERLPDRKLLFTHPVFLLTATIPTRSSMRHHLWLLIRTLGQLLEQVLSKKLCTRPSCARSF